MPFNSISTDKEVAAYYDNWLQQCLTQGYDLKWLKDFLVLAIEKNKSRLQSIKVVTQGHILQNKLDAIHRYEASK